MGARASRFQENPVIPAFGKDVPRQHSYRRTRCSRPTTAASLMVDLSEGFEETLLGRPEQAGGSVAGHPAPGADATPAAADHLSLSSGIGQASPPASATGEDETVSPDPEAPPPVNAEHQARQGTPGRGGAPPPPPPHRTFLERLLVWARAAGGSLVPAGGLRVLAPHQRHQASQPWIGLYRVNNDGHRHVASRCPFCAKSFPGDRIEDHLLSCVTSPPLPYNMDVLRKDAGECCICLDELVQGESIARLACLCVYHKGCIDAWAKVKPCCPEHPFD